MSTSTLPLFWLTDRSHYEMGVGDCPRKRLLTKHAGPTGYGLVMKAESLPLATGTYVHEAARHLFTYLKDTDSLPPADVVREAVRVACQQYEQEIGQRGFRGLLASETSDQVIREQQCLITGLIWALVLKLLPWFHREYSVVSCEEENLVVLDCTCGLTESDDARLHQEKGCDGVAIQLRQDIIGKKRAGGGLAYFELKTTSSDVGRFQEEWETKPQLALGTLRAVEQWGEPITELYVIGLYKGYRGKIRDEQDQVIGVRQESPFCYGYRRPANPPLATEDWKPSYRYTDEAGKRKQLTKDYQKASVAEIASGDWPVWVSNHAQDPDLSPEECWVRTLPDHLLESQLYLIGPMVPQAHQLQVLRRSIVAEERRWQMRLWDLYTLLQEHAWGSEEIQAFLDREFPPSWRCRPYGANHQCSFMPICFREDGWADPLSTGRYIPRRPHHAPELAQAVARGLLPEQAGEGEQED